jgi:hypothetical protein
VVSRAADSDADDLVDETPAGTSRRGGRRT